MTRTGWWILGIVASIGLGILLIASRHTNSIRPSSHETTAAVREQHRGNVRSYTPSQPAAANGAQESDEARNKETHGSAGTKTTRFSTWQIERADLNTPVSPYGVYVDVTISGQVGHERWVRVVVQKGRKVDLSAATHREWQVLPYSYKWQLRNQEGKPTHEWLAHFIQNRDLTYHTIVRLPLEDLRRSHLLLYFEDLDSDGRRDDVTFDVDMTALDWNKR